jgi:hypothetical protein
LPAGCSTSKSWRMVAPSLLIVTSYNKIIIFLVWVHHMPWSLFFFLFHHAWIYPTYTNFIHHHLVQTNRTQRAFDNIGNRCSGKDYK